MNAVFKKLNYKNQQQLFIINAPKSFKAETDEMKQLAMIRTSLTGAKNIEFLLVFVTKQLEVDAQAKKIMSILSDDGLVWFAYPKQSSKKYTCEFNRDNGWTLLGKAGLEPVRMVAIDEDWSALRFRKVAHIKTMTRSFALTVEGKQKVEAAKIKKKS